MMKKFMGLAVALVCGGLWALDESNAVVVWDRDFDVTSKVGSDGNTFTFDKNGNAIENGCLKITSNVGGLITLGDGASASYTILIKYSGVAAKTGKTALLSLSTSNANVKNIGVYMKAGTNDLSTYWDYNTTDYSLSDAKSASADGYLQAAYSAGKAFYVWTGADLATSENNGTSANGLSFSNTSAQIVGLGGPTRTSNNTPGACTGMVIESVALFKGSYSAVNSTQTTMLAGSMATYTATLESSEGAAAVEIPALTWKNKNNETVDYSAIGSTDVLAILGTGKVTGNATMTNRIFVDKGIELVYTDNVAATHSGSGTVTFSGLVPNDIAHNYFAANNGLWTGTVKISNKDNATGKVYTAKYSNKNSTICLNGTSGYFNDIWSGGSSDATFCLEDYGDTVAWKQCNGTSDGIQKIKKLTGSGTWTAPNGATQTTGIADGSAFTGGFDFTVNACIKFGATTSYAVADRGYIIVNDDATVQIAKLWKPTLGLRLNGTIVAKGGTLGANTTFGDAATLVLSDESSALSVAAEKTVTFGQAINLRGATVGTVILKNVGSEPTNLSAVQVSIDGERTTGMLAYDSAAKTISYAKSQETTWKDTAATGNWDDEENWSNGVPTADRVAIIGSAASITLSASSTAKSVVVSENATLNGTAASDKIKDVIIAANKTLTVSSAQSIYLSGVEGGALVKDGSGTLSLRVGSNDRSLNDISVTINGGKVELRDAKISGVAFTIAESACSTTSSPLDCYGWFVAAGDWSVETSGDARIFNNGGANAAVVSGTGNFTKLGAGTVTMLSAFGNALSAGNNYTGAFTVSAGTMRLAPRTVGDNFNSYVTGRLTVANGAVLEIAGDTQFTFNSATNQGDVLGTLNILSGTTQLNGSDRALRGTLNIAKGATLKALRRDYPNYDGSCTVNVKGTLNLDVQRWTFPQNCQLNLYPGAQVIGNDSGVNGGCHINHFNPNCVLRLLPEEGNAETEATVQASIGPQGSPLSVDVADGLVLKLAATAASAHTTRRQAIDKTGAGVLEISGVYDTLAGITLSEGTIVATDSARLPAVGVTSGVADKILKATVDGGATTYSLVPPPPAEAGVSGDPATMQPVLTITDAPANTEVTVTVTAGETEKTYTATSDAQGTVTVPLSGEGKTLDGDKGYTYVATAGGATVAEGGFVTGDVYFRADPAGDSLNGSWGETAPAVSGGAFLIESEDGMTFTIADKTPAADKAVLIDQTVTFSGVADLSGIDESQLSGAVCAVTVVEETVEETTRTVWKAWNGESWTTLDGTVPELPATVSLKMVYDPSKKTFTAEIKSQDGATTYATSSATVKKDDVSGVTYIGNGELAKLEGVTAPVIAYIGIDDSQKLAVSISDAFAQVVAGKATPTRAEVQAALNENANDAVGLKKWQAYVLGVTTAEGLAEADLVVDFQGVSATARTLSFSDGYTANQQKAGVRVTRTVLAGPDLDHLEPLTATEATDTAVTITLPESAPAVNYFKIRYDFE